MKKYFWVIVLSFAFFPISCFASPIVYERTPNNYYVPSDVEVDFSNVQDVMKTPAVDESQKIYDLADVLSEEEEMQIQNRIRLYSDNTGVDSVIVITSDLVGFPISDYAYNFYDYNNFKQEGIILIININEENPEIFMGNSGYDESRVFKVYSDSRINEILKYVFSKYIIKKDYFDACIDYVTLTEEMYSKSFGNYIIDEFGNIISNVPWFEVIVMSLAFTFIAITLISKKTNIRNKGRNAVKDSVNNTSMIIKCEYDKLVEPHK